MSQYEKGAESKKNMLKAAKHLFYKDGYEATTVRDIAKLSGLNLGSLKYYFGSKSDMALVIYLDFQKILIQWVHTQGFDAKVQHLISETIELQLCFESSSFARFFIEIHNEPRIQECLQEKACSHFQAEEVEKIFMAVDLLALKPALVRRYLSEEGKRIAKEAYLSFYIRRLICLDGEEDEGLCQKVVSVLEGYYYNVVDNFTPVLVKINVD